MISKIISLKKPSNTNSKTFVFFFLLKQYKKVRGNEVSRVNVFKWKKSWNQLGYSVF